VVELEILGEVIKREVPADEIAEIDIKGSKVPATTFINSELEEDRSLESVTDPDEVLAELEVDIDETTVSELEAPGKDRLLLLELDEIVVDVNVYEVELDRVNDGGRTPAGN
jgi:flagellar assembly factor FliW